MADPAPLLAPDELQPPPRDTANSIGGGIDAADLPPPAANPPGRASDHEDAGWRGIPAATP